MLWSPNYVLTVVAVAGMTSTNRLPWLVDEPFGQQKEDATREWREEKVQISGKSSEISRTKLSMKFKKPVIQFLKLIYTVNFSC